MTTDSRDIIEQAIAWHLREATMVEADWHALAVWLEVDPAHARAYDRLTFSMRFADGIGYAPAPEVVPDIAPGVAPDRRIVARSWPLRSRGLLLGGGAAMGAALAAGLALFLVQTPATMPLVDRLIVTGAGAPRVVALADGSMIELNGASRLRIDSGNPRRVALDAGEATFHVRHDRGAPFTVWSGDMMIEDVGTVFNVSRTDDVVDVAVAEGEVAFRYRGDTAALRAGDAVSARDAARGIVRASIPVEDVGSWRHGRLSFTAEPVSRLAEAMRRRYGTRISLSSPLARLPITGMITLTGDANRDVPHIAALMGARYSKDGERWVLSSPPPAQD